MFNKIGSFLFKLFAKVKLDDIVDLIIDFVEALRDGELTEEEKQALLEKAEKIVYALSGINISALLSFLIMPALFLYTKPTYSPTQAFSPVCSQNKYKIQNGVWYLQSRRTPWGYRGYYHRNPEYRSSPSRGRSWPERTKPAL